MLIEKLVFGSVLLIAMIVLLVLRVRNRMGVFRFSVLMASTILLFLMVAFIEMVTKVANLVHVDRGVDFLFYIGFGVLLVLVGKLYIKLDNLDRNLTEVVRQVAVESSLKGATPPKSSPDNEV